MVTTQEPASDESPIRFRAGTINLLLDVRVYRLAAVQKAAYRFARQFTAVIGAPRGDSLPVALTFAPAVSESEALSTAQLFFRELLDQELREKVREETAALRSLLLAVAYSRTGLVPEE